MGVLGDQKAASEGCRFSIDGSEQWEAEDIYRSKLVPIAQIERYDIL